MPLVSRLEKNKDLKLGIGTSEPTHLRIMKSLESFGPAEWLVCCMPYLRSLEKKSQMEIPKLQGTQGRKGSKGSGMLEKHTLYKARNPTSQLCSLRGSGSPSIC